MTALEQLDKAEAAAEGFRYAYEAFDAVRTALEAAQQETEAWESIGDWCKHKFRMCRYARSGWHHFTLGVPGELGGTVFQGADRLEALIVAAAWCRAELAK